MTHMGSSHKTVNTKNVFICIYLFIVRLSRIIDNTLTNTAAVHCFILPNEEVTIRNTETAAYCLCITKHNFLEHQPEMNVSRRCTCGCWVNLPEEEHVVWVEPIDNTALLLKRQHADVQLPGVEKVQDHLDDLHLLHIYGFFRCHDDDGLSMTRAMKQNTNTHQ